LISSDDDLAGVRIALTLHHDEVAGKDAGLDHRVTTDLKHELSPRPANCSGIDMSFMAVLRCEHSRTGGGRHQRMGYDECAGRKQGFARRVER